MLLNVWNWSLLRSKGKVQNWVRRRSHNLNLCEAHGLNTWGQLPHLVKMTEHSVLCGELRAPRCPGFYRLVLHALPLTYVSYIVIAGQWIFLYKVSSIKCPAIIRSENMSEQAQGDLVTNPVTGRRTSTERPVTGLGCHEERCNRKRIHTHFLKDRNCEMQEGQNNLGLYARDAQVKPYLEEQNLGESFFLRDVNRETITDTLSFCDLPRINPWNLWNRCFKWLRGWSWIRHKLLDWPRLTGSSPVERDYFVNWLPKPTSFLTQCCLVASVVHQFRPGQTKTNGIWKRAISQDLDRTDGRTDGARVDSFPRIHFVGNSRRNSKDDGGIKVWTWAISRKTTLLTDRAVQFATAKTYVFSDSVLCLGGITTEPVKAWERKIKCFFLEMRYLKDLYRIDGEQKEFEWTTISQDLLHCRSSFEVQKKMTESKCEPEQFKRRIIFMSMQWLWLDKTRK